MKTRTAACILLLAIVSIASLAQTAAPAAAPATHAVIVTPADIAAIQTAQAAQTTAQQAYSQAVQAAMNAPAILALKTAVVQAQGNYQTAVSAVYAKYAAAGVDPQKHVLSVSSGAFIPANASGQRGGGSRGGAPSVAP